ncbi:CRIB domain-containing protein RIC4 [Sesamum alatum]|uniref:CRIB domain-containing protein RIC4 n=1 Tax=Sesamum alatum TaxID=300844 RepID=A0AAE1YNJ3_9LAMI|nr:CRIB domain-containing protein RIC4 [Sesamum alatum]
MRDRMQRFVLLPFTAGCISESSIPVVMQHPKRSKPNANLIPTRPHEVEEEGYLDDEESLSGENLKSAHPRFQKLFKNFKNFSQLFMYKDELEPEMGMEIGFPTDVKHVTHIGLDGCGTSILTKGWNNLAESELINLRAFSLTQLELAMAKQAETPNMRSLLENNMMMPLHNED